MKWYNTKSKEIYLKEKIYISKQKKYISKKKICLRKHLLLPLSLVAMYTYDLVNLLNVLQQSSNKWCNPKKNWTKKKIQIKISPPCTMHCRDPAFDLVDLLDVL